MALSETALAFAQNVKFRGPLEGATHFGQSGAPGDGPYFQVWLVVQEWRIAQSAYQTHGCPASMAVGGTLCAVIGNREVRKVRDLTREDIAHIVGSVPEGKEFNYGLAADALRAALEEN